jgi:hypothetical protein
MIEMSIPKSKMLSASRAIMAIANKTRESREISHKSIQNQTVNINLQRTENPSVLSTNYSSVPEIQTKTEPAAPVVLERSVSIEPTVEVQTPTSNPSYTEELNSLYNMVNNYETVAQALILIIDIMQSNPLMINKFIVPKESYFRDLICVLTNAEDVDIKRVEEVGCTLSSKKYDLIDDIFVIKDGEPKNLKYAYPEVARLFDRFNISIKMITG